MENLQNTLAQSQRPSILTQEPSLEEPDGLVQMYVSQIPRSWDEQLLRHFFEEYGPICEIHILHDKNTNKRKECCFVTYFSIKSAFAAQNALHNVKTLPGMTQPMQMRISDLHKAKVFVGMLPKQYDENMIQNMFSPFGHIAEIFIIKHVNGQSKGCAMITFFSRQSAMYAIKFMHQSQLMEGCMLPLIVKFADTKKGNNAKRLHTTLSNALISVNTNMHVKKYSGSLTCDLLHSSQTPRVLNSNRQHKTGYAGNLEPQLGYKSLSLVPNPLTTQSHLVNHALKPSNGGNMLPTYVSLRNPTSWPNLTNNPNPQTIPRLNPCFHSPVVTAAAAFTHCEPSIFRYVTAHSDVPLIHGRMDSPYIPSMLPITISPLNYIPTTFNNSANFNPSHRQLVYYYNFLRQSSLFTGGQIKGPDGSNLLVYGLPPAYTDRDLGRIFMPFGNVISASICIDKKTRCSRMFGFVSYDNPIVASTAIQTINGARIGMNQLKVQLEPTL